MRQRLAYRENNKSANCQGWVKEYVNALGTNQEIHK